MSGRVLVGVKRVIDYAVKVISFQRAYLGFKVISFTYSLDFLCSANVTLANVSLLIPAVCGTRAK